MKKKVILIILILGIILGTLFLSGCTTQTKECTACDGTGKCNRCGGTGWGIDWDLECNNCDGTGDCPVCSGSGQISEGIPGFEGIYLLLALSIIVGFLTFKRRGKKV